MERATATFDPQDPAKIARLLATGLVQTEALIADVAASRLSNDAKYNMGHELRVKQGQFNDALQQALGIHVLATVTNSATAGDPSGQAGPLAVIPGQKATVNLHIANQGPQQVTVTVANLETDAGPPWKIAPDPTSQGGLAGFTIAAGDAVDRYVTLTVPDSAELTRPYFTRPTVEQPYYDISTPAYQNLPTAPYPLTAEVIYTYGGVTGHVSGVVQAVHRVAGHTPAFEPLLVAPANLTHRFARGWHRSAREHQLSFGCNGAQQPAECSRGHGAS